MSKPERQRPNLHLLVYGDAGARKSDLASSFPRPMLVQLFDPHGKDGPYLRRGSPQGLKWNKTDGIYTQMVQCKDGDIRIEYYHDEDVTDPVAWRAFQGRWDGFDPVDEGYKTVVYDSTTFMALRKRHDCQFRTMKAAKDPRRWYGDTTEALEQVLMGKAASLRCNVVVIAHVSQEKDEVHGSFVFNPSAPGRLSKGLPAGFAEVYRAYVETDKNGNTFRLQTEKDSRFNAATQIPAPDGCAPTYAALWEDWK